jgi:DNA-binding MarR family transcriptional regulator
VTERRRSTRTPKPLGTVLVQAERQVARALEAELTGDGFTLDQWRVLDLLADGEGHPMSEIAAALVVPGPTLTKIIDKLVDSAVVYRLVDARDRRRVLGFLSDHGYAVHERLAPRVDRAESDVLATLGTDAPLLVELIARLASATSLTDGRLPARD